jgi:sterol desaturase/sphingolipid hydroxylase (fatty acid hydroxylase superfamily)
MQLSKLSYYADFIVYPVVVIGLASLAFNHISWTGATEWLGAGLAGLVFWSFMEYVLHRIALHRMRFFSPMHGMHHTSPLAFIGTPTWMSVSILCLTLLVPLWLCLGFSVADGFTVGVMVGYWWYGIVHHVIHHRAATSSPAYFNELRAWHMRHHYSPKSGNFGVTTHIWDHVFGTAIRVRDKAAVSS